MVQVSAFASAETNASATLAVVDEDWVAWVGSVEVELHQGVSTARIRGVKLQTRRFRPISGLRHDYVAPDTYPETSAWQPVKADALTGDSSGDIGVVKKCRGHTLPRLWWDRLQL